jgi:HSP20 family protein
MASTKTTIEKRESQTPELAERTRQGIVFTPLVDIYETKDDIILSAEMPGAQEDSIEITLEKDILSIEASVDFNKPEDMDLQYQEYRIGDFRRTFTLNETIDQDKIKAGYKNGLLTVRLPKAEPAKPKKIAVKVN